jgi:nucleotide-binding universal stress UspA family protein
MLAQRLNCKLVIFNLFDAPVVHSNMGLYGISYSAERISHQNKVAQQIGKLQALFPFVKIAPFVTGGSFKEELKLFTEKHRVELAVMGMETKSKLNKYIYGSHGVSVAGRINAPVIIVPEKYKEHHLAHALLAVDNQEKLMKTSLSDLGRFLKQTHMDLTVTHIRTPDEIMIAPERSIRVNSAKHIVEVRHSATIETGLKKLCAEKSIDMVAIISRKHSAFYNFFSEAHTKTIAFAAKVPVMALHE